MPTITTGNPDACKGTNNNYQYSGVEGVAQTYTINTFSSSYTHWRLVARTNCNFSTGGGLRGSTVTVTPNNYWERLGWWGFQVTGATSLNTSIVAETPSNASTGGLAGNANVFGAFTPTSVANPTYGLKVFNSSANLTLDLSSVSPRILATGGPVTLAPSASTIITVAGLVADGTDLILSCPTTTLAGASMYASYNYVSGVAQNGKFQMNNYNASSTLSSYWIVVRI